MNILNRRNRVNHPMVGKLDFTDISGFFPKENGYEEDRHNVGISVLCDRTCAGHLPEEPVMSTYMVNYGFAY